MYVLTVNAGIDYIWMMRIIFAIRLITNHLVLPFTSEPTIAHVGLAMPENIAMYRLINAVETNVLKKRLFIIYRR